MSPLLEGAASDSGSHDLREVEVRLDVRRLLLHPRRHHRRAAIEAVAERDPVALVHADEPVPAVHFSIWSRPKSRTVVTDPLVVDLSSKGTSTPSRGSIASRPALPASAGFKSSNSSMSSLPAVVLHGHVPGPEGRSGLSECPAGEAEVPIWRSWYGPWTATPRGPCSWPGACRG